MAAVSRIFTMDCVAEMLGESQEWLEEIAIEMDPEDGLIYVVGKGDASMTAFSDFGIENLKELITEIRRPK